MEEASITHTPTWVVAVVCFAIVSVSLAAERFLHHLGKLLKHKDQKALYSALERLKEELMLLGFISFVLSLSEGFIVGICISENAMRLMLPCKKESYRHSEGVKLCKKKVRDIRHYRILRIPFLGNVIMYLIAFLGEVPLLSVEALHQLHIFIFILGLVHVVSCATTILLGGAKIRKWKLWELGIHKEVQQKLQQTEATPGRIARNQQGEFVSERTKGLWMKLAVVSWIIAFLKQFHDSVSKSDYRALRSAFGLKHFPSHPDFNFHKYMVRALEHDFKRVVGISWYMWLFVILFLLLNINGWHTYFWLAFLPLFLLLVVGAKLEHIITRLAQEAAVVASLSHGTEGTPNVKPSKEHFWFGRPEIVLNLIHFILFQNSFEIGFFIWVLVTFGFDSCIMEKKVYAISRLVIGVLIQVICSYVTLPLYAIVTHMDGGIKLQGLGSGLHESVTGWALDARKKKEEQQSSHGGGGGAGGATTDVEVTEGSNRSEHLGGSPRSALAPPPPPPDLVEIVSVIAAAADGDDSHHRR